MRIVTQVAIAALGAATMTTAPNTAGAQGTTTPVATTDARWEAFVGCWAPEPGIPGPTAVCVLPAGSARVELVTIADGKVASREAVDASGVASPSIREKCEGTDRGRWSADGRRLFLVSEHLCDGATRVRVTGIMALPSGNEWLDVRGVSVAGGPTDVRVRRYHAIAPTASAIPASLVEEVQAATAERPTIRAASRTNAASEFGIDETIEATRTIDEAVVEAWLVENGDGFEMDKAKLVRLADARVPSRVIDVMVALSFPNQFAIGRRWQRGEVPQPKVDTTITRPTDVGTTPIYGGLYGEPYSRGRNRNRYCDDLLITAVSRCYAYNDPHGLGYSPWGWGNNGWGLGYGSGPGQPPVIVVNPGKEQRGRVVNGTGYTRGRPSTTDDGSDRVAQPRSNGGSNGSSGDRATTRSSGGSNDGGSKSSGGRESTGRTAKPKNP